MVVCGWQRQRTMGVARQYAVTRSLVLLHIGDRSGNSAQALWQSLPAIYRQCAVIYTRPLAKVG